MLYLAIAVLAVLAALVLGYALLRKPRAAASRIEHDLEVYRAQLDELSREREAGLVSEAEAASAKLEIERRVLAADRMRSEDSAPRGRRREWISAALVAGLVPLGALGLYAWLGNPRVPSVPFNDQAAASAAQRQAGPESLPDVEIMLELERVRERLAQNPDDLQGWTVLARGAVAIGRYDEAIAAFDRALRLAGPNAELLSAKAEATILAAQGQVTAEARAALRQALDLEPEHPRANFYLATAQQQDGDLKGALDTLTKLLQGAPAEAPWVSVVRDRAAALATGLGLDPATVLPAPTASTAAEPEAPRGITPDQQLETIRGMVEGLAARLKDRPDDVRGWRMLARSYGVLNETEKAAEAYAQVLALAPEDPDALFFLGDAALKDGDKDQAAAYWTRLLPLLPPGSAEHTMVRGQLDSLKSAN